MKKTAWHLAFVLLPVLFFNYRQLALGSTVFMCSEPPVYRVERIVPVDSIYLIYARNERGRIFKIVSRNEVADSCCEIKTGCAYEFNLVSRLANATEGPLAKYDFSLLRRTGNVQVFDFWGVPVGLEGDSITDLFTSRNIKGLCYLK